MKIKTLAEILSLRSDTDSVSAVDAKRKKSSERVDKNTPRKRVSAADKWPTYTNKRDKSDSLTNSSRIKLEISS